MTCHLHAKETALMHPIYVQYVLPVFHSRTLPIDVSSYKLLYVKKHKVRNSKCACQSFVWYI